ncbi:Small-conductance mechanosensitive channel [Allopseudospirillum japonicum]|uniref:Small-conductance mechanosensitive channel n=1 Tax=Allopseudospirillum japonicum TaxID=64971 RepID=A0A1H6UHI4_9GAMM|nr:mechanosensitive ion channel family protein [Allopseudospirillum japonicum]SEI87242.1 Small-conductance mechanosensitive channel [Allopseudospirillum japonicum]
MQALEELQTTYVQGISDLHLLSLQQYATAMELKKQLGRGELPAEQAPEGLLQALRKEPLRTLEQTLSEAINQRAHTRFRIISLGGQIAEERAQQEALATEAAKAAEEGAASEDPAASAPTSTASTTEEATPATPTQAEALAPLQALVGQRLDLLADLDRLEAERLQQEATLTGSERLEQQAENRMREGSGWLEAILSVLPSDRAAELTELLRGNYQKLLIVEAQQALLATEKEKVAQLIQLTQEDRQASAQALPLLKAQLQALTLQQDTLWVSAQAQLQPQKADQLKADFSVRTGISLPSAPPLLEKNKADFIARVQDELLTLYVQKLALQQWIPVLEQRQASTLLNEIAHYRDHEGQLNALDASFMRMVKRLTGHTQEELAQLPERQQPSTHLETIYFLEGEIGADHEQRSQALLRALLRFVFELFAIIYGTWFLIMMAKRFVNRRSQEIEMRAGPESTHQLFVLSFSFVAFRLVVVLLAATLALSRMGFDIGVIVASLGIGGFAVALAAKETLSDLIGGITLFVEHSFSIGDVIQISSSDPKMGAAEVGRVEAVSWRVTRITNVMNYSITIPNGRVSESVIINYTRQAQLRDFTHVYISPAYSTRQVVALINEAVDECNLIRQDLQKQVLATGNTVIDKVLVSRYEIRWYTDIPYLARARVLTELWTRLWQKFHEAGLSLEYGLPQEVQAPALPAQAKTLPQQPPTHSA